MKKVKVIVCIITMLMFATGCATEVDMGTISTDDGPQTCFTDAECELPGWICLEGFYDGYDGERCVPEICRMEYGRDMNGVIHFQDPPVAITECPAGMVCVDNLEEKFQMSLKEKSGLGEEQILGTCVDESELPRGWGNAVEDGDIPDGDEPEDGDMPGDSSEPEGEEPVEDWEDQDTAGENLDDPEDEEEPGEDPEEDPGEETDDPGEEPATDEEEDPGDSGESLACWPEPGNWTDLYEIEVWVDLPCDTPPGAYAGYFSYFDMNGDSVQYDGIPLDGNKFSFPFFLEEALDGAVYVELHQGAKYNYRRTGIPVMKVQTNDGNSVKVGELTDDPRVDRGVYCIF